VSDISVWVCAPATLVTIAAAAAMPMLSECLIGEYLAPAPLKVVHLNFICAPEPWFRFSLSLGKKLLSLESRAQDE
jgi:hypothetical protein